MHRVRGTWVSPTKKWAPFFCVLVSGATLVGACGGDDPAPTVLQAADLKKPDPQVAPFDRNVIVDSSSFTDFESLNATAIQRFLGKTPYDRRSFLETYQSNGVRASDAIIRAARTYRINPLVFLVFAEAAQGLLGERNYPFPPDRVEYVFRCGCIQASSCLPQLAGFDRQVDCLGQALRAALDEIKVNEATTTGWGPNRTSTTLDNVKVTPENDATAALYDRTPRVNEGAPGGTWVFWNVWNLYAAKLDYTGPIGNIDGRWIGEECVSDASCGVPGGLCATDYPGGLCTAPCTGECPSQTSRPAAFCAKFRDSGYCVAICNPAASSCRPGYKCVLVEGVRAGDPKTVCSPE